MDNKSIKNMVVLKNLPSNIVEEAIVILKSNRMAKRLEYIDKKVNTKSRDYKKRDDYIIKEAESIVSNYIEKIEFNEKNNSRIKVSKKYKILRNYSIVVSILFVLTLLLSGSVQFS